MYKVVISDLDGTLLNDEHIISEKTSKIIKKIQEKGILFVIATGRVYNDAKLIAEEAGINCPIISCNGGCLTDENGNHIYNKFVDDEISKKIFNYALNIIDGEYIMHVVKDNNWYQFPKANDDSKFDTKHKKPNYVRIEDFKIEKINKIFFTGEDNKNRKIKEFIENNNIQVSHAETFKWCYEIFPAGLNKGIAIKKLLDIKGYSLDEVISFGDGMNDKEMLEEVKKGFIMKNANINLKNSLPHLEIIDFNYNDGVSKKLIEIFNME